MEKVRKLSRTFPASATKLYTLDTRYGRVQVNVWNRAEVRTDVDIITRAETEEKAQELQDMIQVQIQDKDPVTGGIVARSRFGALPRECRSRTKLYEVNYTVWVPRNNPLALHNTFGEISLTGDLTGATELSHRVRQPAHGPPRWPAQYPASVQRPVRRALRPPGPH